MSNNDNLKDVIQRPAAPTRRKSVPRLQDSEKWETYFESKMTKNKARAQNTSSSMTNDSPTTSSPKTPLNTSIDSPELGDRLRNRRSGTESPGLYPDLSSEIDQSRLDVSYISFSRSFNDSRTPERKKKSNSPKGTTKNPSRSSDSVKNESQKDSKHKSFLSGIIFGILLSIVLLGILSSILRYNSSRESPPNEVTDEQYLISHIKELRSLFPSQDENTWGNFVPGIADVKSGDHKPGIFLLLGNHHETTYCLGKRVAKLAQSVLNGSGNVVMYPRTLENDIGKVLNLVEDRINKTKALVFPDILSFQPEAIRAFHDICDEYSPVNPKAVYVFTMNYDVRGESGRKLTELAENQLRNKFANDIKKDTLEPLIVRITAGTVLFIEEETKITSCE